MKTITQKIIMLVFVLVLLTSSTVNAITVSYTPMGVPNINSSWKTWMDYRAITNKSSAQYKLIHNWGWVDGQGFMRVNGERDLGITDDYYMIALGSYYGSKMGTKYRFTTNTGNVFYGILSDAKAYPEVNSTNQYGLRNKDIVECLVYTPMLNKEVKMWGTANVYMPLNGSITKIERIDFTYE